MDVKGEQRIWSCQGVVEMGVVDLEMVPIQVKLLRIYPTWGHIRMVNFKTTEPLVLITVQVCKIF